MKKLLILLVMLFSVGCVSTSYRARTERYTIHDARLYPRYKVECIGEYCKVYDERMYLRYTIKKDKLYDARLYPRATIK
jgi:hypothetical protein